MASGRHAIQCDDKTWDKFFVAVRCQLMVPGRRAMQRCAMRIESSYDAAMKPGTSSSLLDSVRSFERTKLLCVPDMLNEEVMAIVMIRN